MVKSWRKLNNLLHRDIGYLFFGMAVIYGLSGIALNHINDWDPSYIISRDEFIIDKKLLKDNLNELAVVALLKKQSVAASYKKHYYPNENTLKVFISGGSLTADIPSGRAILELVRKRPLFFEVNYLHYNHAGALWTWFSDIFSAGLIVMAITGLFIVRGKNSFKKRGVWFVLTGIAIPLIFLVLYYINN